MCYRESFYGVKYNVDTYIVFLMYLVPLEKIDWLLN